MLIWGVWAVLIQKNRCFSVKCVLEEIYLVVVHFLKRLKNGSWREAQQKLEGLEKNLGGKKIFREG